MTAKKYNPGLVEVDPDLPYNLDFKSSAWATFHGPNKEENCAFVVEAINAAVDKLEKEGDAHE